MPNQLQIKHYINYYQQILANDGFFLSLTQLNQLFPVINLIFEIDSLYDAKGVSFSQSKVKCLHEKMSRLLSESSPMTQPAVERFFQAMKEESTGSPPNCLKDLSCGHYTDIPFSH